MLGPLAALRRYRKEARRNQGKLRLVNIHEPGPFEGQLAQWPVLAVSGSLEADTDAVLLSRAVCLVIDNAVKYGA